MESLCHKQVKYLSSALLYYTSPVCTILHCILLSCTVFHTSILLSTPLLSHRFTFSMLLSLPALLLILRPPSSPSPSCTLTYFHLSSSSSLRLLTSSSPYLSHHIDSHSLICSKSFSYYFLYHILLKFKRKSITHKIQYNTIE